MNGWQTSEQFISCVGKNNLYAVTTLFSSEWEYRGPEVTSKQRNSQARTVMLLGAPGRKEKVSAPKEG